MYAVVCLAGTLGFDDLLWLRLQGVTLCHGLGCQRRLVHKVVDTHRVRYWASGGNRKKGKKMLDPCRNGFHRRCTKAFPAVHISIAPSENNGIYLPIRQLGRLKGRREQPSNRNFAGSKYRESGLHGPVQSI